jgi:hypothetical protein
MAPLKRMRPRKIPKIRCSTRKVGVGGHHQRRDDARDRAHRGGAGDAASVMGAWVSVLMVSSR